jgi:hypothetical protein
MEDDLQCRPAFADSGRREATLSLQFSGLNLCESVFICGKNNGHADRR